MSSFLVVCVEEFAKAPASREESLAGLNRLLDKVYGDARWISPETLRCAWESGLTIDQMAGLIERLERDHHAATAIAAQQRPPNYRGPRTKQYGPYQDAEHYWSPEKERAYAFAALFREGPPVARLSDREWWPLVRLVFKRDGYLCTYCGAPDRDYILHCDHIAPISRGGPNIIENLTTACEHCNSSKRDALPNEWRPLRGSAQ